MKIFLKKIKPIIIFLVKSIFNPLSLIAIIFLIVSLYFYIEKQNYYSDDFFAFNNLNFVAVLPAIFISSLLILIFDRFKNLFSNRVFGIFKSILNLVLLFLLLNFAFILIFNLNFFWNYIFFDIKNIHFLFDLFIEPNYADRLERAIGLYGERIGNYVVDVILIIEIFNLTLLAVSFLLFFVNQGAIYFKKYRSVLFGISVLWVGVMYFLLNNFIYDEIRELVHKINLEKKAPIISSYNGKCEINRFNLIRSFCTPKIKVNGKIVGTGISYHKPFVVTNRRVLEGAASVSILSRSLNETESEIEAEIWGYSYDQDIAILKYPEDTEMELCIFNTSTNAESYVGYDATNRRSIEVIDIYKNYFEPYSVENPWTYKKVVRSENYSISTLNLGNTCGIAGMTSYTGNLTQYLPNGKYNTFFDTQSLIGHVSSLLQLETGNKNPPNRNLFFSKNLNIAEINTLSFTVGQIKSHINDIADLKQIWQIIDMLNEQKQLELLENFNEQIQLSNQILNFSFNANDEDPVTENELLIEIYNLNMEAISIIEQLKS